MSLEKLVHSLLPLIGTLCVPQITDLQPSVYTAQLVGLAIILVMHCEYWNAFSI